MTSNIDIFMALSHKLLTRFSGLAWAICEHVVEVIKAPTLLATHFHQLTALAHENPKHKPHSKHIVGVANYHVSAHIDLSTRKLTMLYKVDIFFSHIFLVLLLYLYKENNQNTFSFFLLSFGLRLFQGKSTLPVFCYPFVACLMFGLDFSTRYWYLYGQDVKVVALRSVS